MTIEELQAENQKLRNGLQYAAKRGAEVEKVKEENFRLLERLDRAALEMKSISDRLTDMRIQRDRCAQTSQGPFCKIQLIEMRQKGDGLFPDPHYLREHLLKCNFYLSQKK